MRFALNRIVVLIVLVDHYTLVADVPQFDSHRFICVPSALPRFRYHANFLSRTDPIVSLIKYNYGVLHPSVVRSKTRMHTGITCVIVLSRQSYNHTPRFHSSIELINLWVRVSQCSIDINLPFLMADRVFTMSPQMDVSVGKCRVTIPIKYFNNNDEHCDPVPFFRLSKTDGKPGK